MPDEELRRLYAHIAEAEGGHPSEEVLGRLLAGRLRWAEREGAVDHVARCAECAALVQHVARCA